jgi:hypothetical protein
MKTELKIGDFVMVKHLHNNFLGINKTDVGEIYDIFKDEAGTPKFSVRFAEDHVFHGYAEHLEKVRYGN